MFSRTLEVLGFGVVAWGLAWAISTPAGLIFGGAAMVLIGSVTDDASVGLALRRGTAWFRYAWRRQLARESGLFLPARRKTPEHVPCTCGGNEECPICDGTGLVPNPTLRVNPKSPHPPLRVDADAEEFYASIVRSREARATGRNGRDLERLG
jgi:hypothetical protein